MSQDTAFEKFFPRPLVFADKAHELETMSKWNDAKITWVSSLQATTAEANKRMAELEGEVFRYKEIADTQLRIIENIKGVCEDMGTTDMFTALCRKDTAIAKLQTSNNHLRSLLMDARDDVSAELDNCAMKLPYKTERYEYQKTLLDNIDKALKATPAESLQSHDDKDTERLNFLDRLQERATSDMKINMSLKSDIHINGNLGVSLYIRNYKGHTESTAYGKTIREAIDMALKEVK